MPMPYLIVLTLVLFALVAINRFLMPEAPEQLASATPAISAPATSTDGAAYRSPVDPMVRAPGDDLRAAGADLLGDRFRPPADDVEALLPPAPMTEDAPEPAAPAAVAGAPEVVDGPDAGVVDEQEIAAEFSTRVAPGEPPVAEEEAPAEEIAANEAVAGEEVARKEAAAEEQTALAAPRIDRPTSAAPRGGSVTGGDEGEGEIAPRLARAEPAPAAKARPAAVASSEPRVAVVTAPRLREPRAALERSSPEASPAEIARAQRLLARLGYGPGPADGHVGPQTEQAVRSYEKRTGKPVTGQISPRLLGSLETMAGRMPVEVRPVAAPAPQVAAARLAPSAPAGRYGTIPSAARPASAEPDCRRDPRAWVYDRARQVYRFCAAATVRRGN
jgi:hypothetical protein